jgi:hypothetical protein
LRLYHVPAQSQTTRAGLLAVFSQNRGLRRKRYALLSVHFPACAEPKQVRERQTLWARTLQIAAHTRDGGTENVPVLGDVHSTGYRDNAHRERDAIHHVVERAGFRILTPDVGGTEYSSPQGQATFQPSHLDHIVASVALATTTPARVLSFCESLRCAPAQTMPSDYHTVSDHCPVLIDVR